VAQTNGGRAAAGVVVTAGGLAGDNQLDRNTRLGLASVRDCFGLFAGSRVLVKLAVNCGQWVRVVAVKSRNRHPGCVRDKKTSDLTYWVS
jgi:hypothetical protein